ncbi:MAG TPA: disulfide bond formation protein B, partial [Novosphingobium sp.]|nr:disulfide bond formation protein B [Novosphingobium sp.]
MPAIASHLRLRLARLLALGLPAVLLGGAYVSEYGFGLHPCEMCWWQRWAPFAALGLALVAWVWRASAAPGWLAAVGVPAAGPARGLPAPGRQGAGRR